MQVKRVWGFRIYFLLLCLTGCKIGPDDETTDIKVKAELQKAAISKIAADMVHVIDGAFLDGCPDDSGQKNWVAVRNFYISKFEVSQDEWEAIMDTNPSLNKCPTCPVSNINFNKAQKFIMKLNSLSGKKYRLPSDVEWKFMKRGGRPSIGYKYSSNKFSGFDSLPINIHDVGQLDSNELGIYDLDSNDAWEFCNALVQTGYIQVMRSAYSVREDHDRRWCVISYRSFISPKRRENCLGLRLARD